MSKEVLDTDMSWGGVQFQKDLIRLKKDLIGSKLWVQSFADHEEAYENEEVREQHYISTIEAVMWARRIVIPYQEEIIKFMEVIAKYPETWQSIYGDKEVQVIDSIMGAHEMLRDFTSNGDGFNTLPTCKDMTEMYQHIRESYKIAPNGTHFTIVEGMITEKGRERALEFEQHHLNTLKIINWKTLRKINAK